MSQIIEECRSRQIQQIRNMIVGIASRNIIKKYIVLQIVTIFFSLPLFSFCNCNVLIVYFTRMTSLWMIYPRSWNNMNACVFLITDRIFEETLPIWFAMISFWTIHRSNAAA